MGLKKDDRYKYVISRTKDLEAWYCHMKGYPYIPVFGSIGTKVKAEKVCRIMNVNKGYSSR